MSQAREIRTKIKSIKNTQKITHAMELVAASKMRKAQERMILARPYADKIYHVLTHVVAAHSEYQHPLLQKRPQFKRVGYILVTTDRGLCGGLNINLFRAVLQHMKQWNDKSAGIDMCILGRKGESFFKKIGANVVASATHLGDVPDLQKLVGVVKVMLDRFNQGEVDEIFIAYNRFVSTMRQEPVVTELVAPLPEKEIAGQWDYIYEPDSAPELIDLLMVRYIESQVYRAVVENLACFQAAQMLAMKNATDNAEQLIDELHLIYNKERQAAITREISEIVGGAAGILT